MIKRLVTLFFIVVTPFSHAYPTDNDSIMITLKSFINKALAFNEKLPREKVYVHLDNTGYYAGDKIWFQCYVVDGTNNAPTKLSNTLYVELLNPRGRIVAKQTLRIEDGRCHGTFNLNHLPFYSGFYEIRAFTKYMLNFGNAALFSRVIPVYDPPKQAGDFSERRMARDLSKYPGTRPVTQAGPNVSMRFFPEGGSLIAGIPSKVAFEITGQYGMPLDVTGKIIDESTGQTVVNICSLHEGRGVFEFTPEMAGNYQAVITPNNDNSVYKFKLPRVRENGIGLSVDNLSNPDSILVTLRPKKGEALPDIAGVSITARGILWSYSLVNLNKERTLKISSRDMPSGVSVITLFGPDGMTLAERMIFINNGGYGEISASFDKSDLEPLEKVILNLTATDPNGNPAPQLPLSISIIDGDNTVGYQGGLLSDLLLMSEIKGYVRNPMQFFRENSEISRRNLDLLMMVLGWRCYGWEEMADIKPIKIKYNPEQAIDLKGQVVSFVRGIPKAGVDVSIIASENEACDSLKQSFTDFITTDSCGYFHLSFNINGKWTLVTSVSEKGKSKDYRVIFDRLFSPSPRKYEPAEIQTNSFISDITTPTTSVDYIDSATNENDDERSLKQIDDSLSIHSIKLEEAVIKGKQSDKYKARSKSLEYYDMHDALSSLADKGVIVGNDFIEILKTLNPNFHRQFNDSEERVMYKTKKPLFVIDYNVTYARDSLNYTLLYPEAVKSIFISEDPVIMAKYADPTQFTPFTIDKIYSCAVLIETKPDYNGPARKGTRLQRIEGYTIPIGLQNIDDACFLMTPDFRRTLYWNPSLTTDSDGKARVEFFNNSICRHLRISIQGIDSLGTIFSY